MAAGTNTVKSPQGSPTRYPVIRFNFSSPFQGPSQQRQAICWLSDDITKTLTHKSSVLSSYSYRYYIEYVDNQPIMTDHVLTELNSFGSCTDTAVSNVTRSQEVDP